MSLNDGATTQQLALASAAGVTPAVAATMSGADLEAARLRRAGGSTSNQYVHSGADLEQRVNRSNVIATGEVNYAAAGGKVTRIIGQGLTGATGAQAGGTAFTSFSVVNDEVIQATTPAKGAGTYDLTILHPDGNIVVTNGITYV